MIQDQNDIQDVRLFIWRGDFNHVYRLLITQPTKMGKSNNFLFVFLTFSN